MHILLFFISNCFSLVIKRLTALKQVFILAWLLALDSTTSVTQAETDRVPLYEGVEFAMGNWCPYHGTCAEGDGYITEMLREIFDRAHIQSSFVPIPWSRAVHETQNGIFDGVMSPGGQALEFYYPSVSTGSFAYCYYTKSQDTWIYTGIHSLTSRVTAYIKDSTMIEDKEFVEDPRNSAYFIPIPYTQSYMLQVVKMLAANRVTTIVNDPNVTQSFLRSYPMYENFLRNAGCIGRSDLWVGLSLHPSKKLKIKHIAEVIDNGIITLRQDGTLKEILDKYGLQDWQ